MKMSEKKKKKCAGLKILSRKLKHLKGGKKRQDGAVLNFLTKLEDWANHG